MKNNNITIGIQPKTSAGKLFAKLALPENDSLWKYIGRWKEESIRYLAQCRANHPSKSDKGIRLYYMLNHLRPNLHHFVIVPDDLNDPTYSWKLSEYKEENAPSDIRYTDEEYDDAMAVIEAIEKSWEDKCLEEMLLHGGIKKSDIDHHYSDLYVRKTERAVEIVHRFYTKARHLNDQSSTFRSCNPSDEGTFWIDCPFQYVGYIERS